MIAKFVYQVYLFCYSIHCFFVCCFCYRTVIWSQNCIDYSHGLLILNRQLTFASVSLLVFEKS
uniref:Uncharacterized protein n=1 Tax=Arundo donax TaxID=35708 RepID=A0A0A9BMJ4_ARUDO